MPKSDFMCLLVGDLNSKLSFSTVMCHHSCGYLSMHGPSKLESQLVGGDLYGKDVRSMGWGQWKSIASELKMPKSERSWILPSLMPNSIIRPNNTSLKHTHEATVVSLRLEDYPTNIMTTPPVTIYLSWRKQDPGAPEDRWVWDSQADQRRTGVSQKQ